MSVHTSAATQQRPAGRHFRQYAGRRGGGGAVSHSARMGGQRAIAAALTSKNSRSSASPTRNERRAVPSKPRLQIAETIRRAIRLLASRWRQSGPLKRPAVQAIRRRADHHRAIDHAACIQLYCVRFVQLYRSPTVSASTYASFRQCPGLTHREKGVSVCE